MKKFLVLAIALLASAASASEITVLEAVVPTSTMGTTSSSAKFFVDTTTNEGFVVAEVTETEWREYPGGYWDQWGRWHPIPQRVPEIKTIFSKKVAIEGLMLMGDQLVYHGATGNVVCGTMGLSRVLKVPTLYLSGNCKLTTKMGYTNGGELLTVKLKTI
jgi:hypothetical protein